MELLRRAVLAQHEVAGKRIGLVVEGGQARLAVECDGDNWHGADRYEADMQRQRQLERCGWEFFRVRESTFHIDKNAALQQLWFMLEERGLFAGACFGGHHSESNKEWQDTEDEQGFEEFNDDEIEEDDDRSFNNDASENAENDPETAGRRAEEVTTTEIQKAIINALSKCPNRSCTVHSMTARVLKEVGVLTRGNPRQVFERRVMRSLNMLEGQGIIEKYKAKNNRIRLVKEMA